MAFLWCLTNKCFNVTKIYYPALISSLYSIKNRQNPHRQLDHLGKWIWTKGNSWIITRNVVHFHWRTKEEMPTLGSHYRDTTHHLTPQLKSQHFLQTPQITQITFLMIMSACSTVNILLDSFQSASPKENSSTYYCKNCQC